MPPYHGVSPGGQSKGCGAAHTTAAEPGPTLQQGEWGSYGTAQLAAGPPWPLKDMRFVSPTPLVGREGLQLDKHVPAASAVPFFHPA